MYVFVYVSIRRQRDIKVRISTVLEISTNLPFKTVASYRNWFNLRNCIWWYKKNIYILFIYVFIFFLPKNNLTYMPKTLVVRICCLYLKFQWTLTCASLTRKPWRRCARDGTTRQQGLSTAVWITEGWVLSRLKLSMMPLVCPTLEH